MTSSLNSALLRNFQKKKWPGNPPELENAYPRPDLLNFKNFLKIYILCQEPIRPKTCVKKNVKFGYLVIPGC